MRIKHVLITVALLLFIIGVLFTLRRRKEGMVLYFAVPDRHGGFTWIKEDPPMNYKNNDHATAHFVATGGFVPENNVYPKDKRAIHLVVRRLPRQQDTGKNLIPGF